MGERMRSGSCPPFLGDSARARALLCLLKKAPRCHLDPAAIDFGMKIATANDFQKTFFKVRGGHDVRDLFLHFLAEEVLFTCSIDIAFFPVGLGAPTVNCMLISVSLPHFPISQMQAKKEKPRQCDDGMLLSVLERAISHYETTKSPGQEDNTKYPAIPKSFDPMACLENPIKNTWLNSNRVDRSNKVRKRCLVG